MATVLDRETCPVPEVRQTRMLIGGRWCNSANGKTFATINPATEEVIAQVAEGDEADVDRAVAAAREAFESGPWPKMDARDRGRLIYRLADLIEKNSDELAALETLDNGKPIRDSRNGDLPLVIDVLPLLRRLGRQDPRQDDPRRGAITSATRGASRWAWCGQIIPWNFPMLMVAWKWGPALATGCTIVMKPAEQTPLTCLRMARAGPGSGLPDGVINVVPGYGPTAGAALVRHTRTSTRSPSPANTARRRSSWTKRPPTLKRLTFELGGKSPNVDLRRRRPRCGRGRGRRSVCS